MKNSNVMRNISENQARNLGLALAFIVLTIAYVEQNHQLLPFAIILLFLCLCWPVVLRLLLTPVWTVFTGVISPFFSKLFLATCFFAVITPIGFLRKMLGMDPLQLKKWKGKNVSVFKIREQTMQKRDMENPF